MSAVDWVALKDRLKAVMKVLPMAALWAAQKAAGTAFLMAVRLVDLLAVSKVVQSVVLMDSCWGRLKADSKVPMRADRTAGRWVVWKELCWVVMMVA